MIYAIQCGENGPIKFGKARNPKDRLRNLQIGNPVQLRLVAAVLLPDECERKIHTHLIANKEGIRGEWFTGPKTNDVLIDLKVRAKCTNHFKPSDFEYVFWTSVEECGGSCGRGYGGKLRVNPGRFTSDV